MSTKAAPEVLVYRTSGADHALTRIILGCNFLRTCYPYPRIALSYSRSIAYSR